MSRAIVSLATLKAAANWLRKHKQINNGRNYEIIKFDRKNIRNTN